ncbi:hypothetical protein [Streptomyces sp. NPDC007088]|uniref:hypothetical protein n=1 Tax=Streptomyces sp. NPDC007088 TaxID=3364773 RepID=UPI0036CABBE4
MPLDEHEGIPARWLMVPAGVDIDLDPPPPPTPPQSDSARHAAVCRHCGARPPAGPPHRPRA